MSRYALEGKVVTMDSNFRVLDRGVVYVDGEQIAAVEAFGAPRPDGFEDCTMVRTGGTIYPGLIELHNHLSYNALPLWDVPKKYSNRSQWRGKTYYRRTVTGPMKALGITPGYLGAIVRFVECKCLMGGVTSSQGISLQSNQGIRKYYRGIVRNVEATVDEAVLPSADTRIADVPPDYAERFKERLASPSCSCFLLHLSEGVDDETRKHFEALKLQSGDWAINDRLAGIHCACLNDEDFRILRQHHASVVWSPMSNLLLYGATVDIKALKAENLLVGIGSDWSPTGSKNLLGELKVARLVSKHE